MLNRQCQCPVTIASTSGDTCRARSYAGPDGLLPLLKSLPATAPSCMLRMIALTPRALSRAAYRLTVSTSSRVRSAGWKEAGNVSVPYAVRWMNPIGRRRPPPASTHSMLYGGTTVRPVAVRKVRRPRSCVIAHLPIVRKRRRVKRSKSKLVSRTVGHGVNAR